MFPLFVSDSLTLEHQDNQDKLIQALENIQNIKKNDVRNDLFCLASLFSPSSVSLSLKSPLLMQALYCQNRLRELYHQGGEEMWPSRLDCSAFYNLFIAADGCGSERRSQVCRVR